MTPAECEAHLQDRFAAARRYATTPATAIDRAAVAFGPGITPRCFQNDIKRARAHETYEAWRPQRRGPKKGAIRATHAVQIAAAQSDVAG